MVSKSSYRRFQSTLPRRERLLPGCPPLFFFHFNPRSREGSDLPTPKVVQICCSYFNPRSREGSDGVVTAGSDICVNFNPRSREGSDSSSHLWVHFHRHFNPRSREGSDSVAIHEFVVVQFQSTLPRRERRFLGGLYR